MDAKLVAKNEHIEIRQATRKNQTWPGWHEGAPLGRCGYWIGTAASHSLADGRLSLAQLCEDYGCDPA